MPLYRAILLIVTVLTFFSIAGIGEISVSLVVTVTILSVAMWILPRIDKWNAQRNTHSREGQRQLQVGNYSEAERELAVAAAEAERRRNSAARRATILRSLAESQQKQGKLTQAEQSIRQAMALVSDPKPESRAQYGQCLEALAGVCEDQKNYPQAQQILQESLNVEEGLPKPNPAVLARRRQKLALAYHHASDYSAASPHFARSLELHEQAFGREHAETGKMLTELGAALQREGNHPEPLRTLERALEIQKKTLSAGVVFQQRFQQAWRHIKAGVYQPFNGGGKVNEAAGGGHVQDAERAHEADLTALGLPSPSAFINEEEGVGPLREHKGDCFAFPFTELI